MLKSNLFLLLIHILVITLIWCGCYQLGLFNKLPNDKNLIQWDAVYFKSIRDVGYSYVRSSQGNLAFFPFFPLLWRLSSISAMGISLFNMLVFALGIITLSKEIKSKALFLFLLSTPSFIFFAVPYSESVFFIFTTLIILGYKNESKWLKSIGFVGASLVKSVSVVFVPAIIITELLAIKDKNFALRNIFYLCLSTILGMLISTIIQGIQTGQLFYYLEIQQYWGRHWILPGFPLTTLTPSRILGIDSIALLLGLIAIYYVIKWFILLLKSVRINVDASIVFSVLYLSATILLDVFFSYNVNGSGNIWSLNRHFFCNSFFVVFLIWLNQDCVFKTFEYVLIFLLIAAGIWFTGVYQYPFMMFYYFSFFLVFILSKYVKENRIYLLTGYFIGIAFQVSFFHDFINGLWIS